VNDRVSPWLMAHVAHYEARHRYSMAGSGDPGMRSNLKFSGSVSGRSGWTDSNDQYVPLSQT
jgi:hypothetical protein